MSMFMGEFNHTIDAKGRLIIPSRFREELGQEFVMTKGLDGCLFVFPQNEWESFLREAKTLPLINKDARKFSRFSWQQGQLREMDKQEELDPSDTSGICPDEERSCINRNG